MYSGTQLIWTLMGHIIVSILAECPHYLGVHVMWVSLLSRLSEKNMDTFFVNLNTKDVLILPENV